ncbi:MAG: ROK family protein [Bacteroidales bacterium]|jgi:glucokinase|nr:ROK family protein [Bacteroidales bacterium]MCI1785076.1 ROK family protein [Bacteroidales bacterium]
MNRGKLLLDIGGTFIKACLADGKGTLIPGSFFSVPMDSAGKADVIIKSLTDSIRQGYDIAGKSGYGISGIGIAIPGPFDFEGGIPLMKHKFAAVYGRPLREIIYGCGIVATGTPVLFMHDVISMLSGEMLYGNATGYGNSAIVALGTGLGFACCIDGKIRYSPMKSPAYPIYNLPYKDGILEDYVSKRGFIKNYGIISGKVPDTGLTVEDIGKMAENGDEAALETFGAVGSIIAANLKEFLKSKDIRCLLFGGQISKSFRYMKDSLDKGLSGMPIKITSAKHIDEATFYGLCGLLKNT